MPGCREKFSPASAFLPVGNLSVRHRPATVMNEHVMNGSLRTLFCKDIQEQELPDGGIIAVKTIRRQRFEYNRQETYHCRHTECRREASAQGARQQQSP